jgi:hypothetical protein
MKEKDWKSIFAFGKEGVEVDGVNIVVIVLDIYREMWEGIEFLLPFLPISFLLTAG